MNFEKSVSGQKCRSGNVGNVGQGSSRVFALWPGLPKTRSAQEENEEEEDENCFKEILLIQDYIISRRRGQRWLLWLLLRLQKQLSSVQIHPEYI